MTQLLGLGITLLLLVSVKAITQDELDQFRAGDGRNRTVEIVDNADGTVTFNVFPPCREDEDSSSESRERPGRRNCSVPLSLSVKKDPLVQDAPAACVPRGLIGFGLEGRPLLSGVRGGKPDRRHKKGRRGGRRQRRHGKSSEESSEESSEVRDMGSRMDKLVEQDALLGVALDGFPIYSANSSEVPDRLLDASDLDQCGGRCDASGAYRYHFVLGRPPVLGCVRGDLVSAADAEECRYYISCNATVGACSGGQDVPADNYTCVAPRLDDPDVGVDKDDDSRKGPRGNGDRRGGDRSGGRRGGRRGGPRTGRTDGDRTPTAEATVALPLGGDGEEEPPTPRRGGGRGGGGGGRRQGGGRRGPK